MNLKKITMVRIYLTESEQLMNTVIKYLKNEAKIRGVTVFRGISGFGESGEHTSSWIDVSLDLPITIEFFDDKEKINEAINYLSAIIKSEHIVFWEAEAVISTKNTST